VISFPFFAFEEFSSFEMLLFFSN